ncbi:MAG: hypothetical protein ACUVXJ_13280 [Phycisphaerae bacterium]
MNDSPASGTAWGLSGMGVSCARTGPRRAAREADLTGIYPSRERCVEFALNSLDLSIIIASLAAVVAVGFWASRRQDKTARG